METRPPPLHPYILSASKLDHASSQEISTLKNIKLLFWVDYQALNEKVINVFTFKASYTRKG